MDKTEEIEKRVGALETAMGTLQEDLNAFKQGVDDKLDQIIVYVTGFNKVLGFTKRNWKTAITFGAGLMTAAGIGNPAILGFVSNFFGA